jgi:enoyl-CoA hydratase/carnithine racemase
MAYDFELLTVTVEAGVATAVIDAPPINIMTTHLAGELAAFAEEVAVDDDVRCVVMRSANPEFFIAHYDVEAILAMPTDRPARRAKRVESSSFHAMCERYRTMPKATIVEIAGRAGGGGSELSMSFDMRFGALGRTVINQLEVAIGILPGGTGTQRLPRLVGRGRAMEIILGCDDIDAETAERWGYLNRALPPDELTPFVDRLARRIALFPAEAIAAAKASVLNAEPDPSEGLLEEGHYFQKLIRTEPAGRLMQAFIDNGGQTRDGELELADLAARINQ